MRFPPVVVGASATVRFALFIADSSRISTPRFVIFLFFLSVPNNQLGSSFLLAAGAGGTSVIGSSSTSSGNSITPSPSSSSSLSSSTRTSSISMSVNTTENVLASLLLTVWLSAFTPSAFNKCCTRSRNSFMILALLGEPVNSFASRSIALTQTSSMSSFDDTNLAGSHANRFCKMFNGFSLSKSPSCFRSLIAVQYILKNSNIRYRLSCSETVHFRP